MARSNGRHHKRHRRDSRILDGEVLLKKSNHEIPSHEVLRLQSEESTADVPLEERLKWGRRSVTSADRLCANDVKPTAEEFRMQTERPFRQPLTTLAKLLGIDSDFSTR